MKDHWYAVVNDETDADCGVEVVELYRTEKCLTPACVFVDLAQIFAINDEKWSQLYCVVVHFHEVQDRFGEIIDCCEGHWTLNFDEA